MISLEASVAKLRETVSAQAEVLEEQRKLEPDFTSGSRPGTREWREGAEHRSRRRTDKTDQEHRSSPVFSYLSKRKRPRHHVLCETREILPFWPELLGDVGRHWNNLVRQ